MRLFSIDRVYRGNAERYIDRLTQDEVKLQAFILAEHIMIMRNMARVIAVAALVCALTVIGLASHLGWVTVVLIVMLAVILATAVAMVEILANEKVPLK